MKFSIIIPLKELNNYLEESIPKILNLSYPKKDYEIIILPNNKPKYIPEYLQHQQIKIVATGCISPATKRDIGAKAATGEILAFMDDDSYPRDDWLIAAENTFNNLDKDYVAINGPAITPPKVNTVEQMSGAFFESKLGGGAAHRCKDIGRGFDIDDAPSVNLLVKREAFIKIGGFGSEYWPGEDSLFCQKLRDKGYKLWHQNNLIVFHHRRDTLRAHLKQVSKYGECRGNFFRKNIGSSRKFTYLIPSLFLIGNLIILFFWIKSWAPLFLIYFILTSLTFSVCPRLPFHLIFLTAALTFASHLTYGVFFIKGFLTKDIRSRLR